MELKEIKWKDKHRDFATFPHADRLRLFADSREEHEEDMEEDKIRRKVSSLNCCGVG